ncbi:MAG TPA: 50S ribosomal protein L11 methyltransferase [Vicinamibacterales bacterium]|nr:50S ribosomal protein L11 methyltransferase [Vicinamibacterales bacterium]
MRTWPAIDVRRLSVPDLLQAALTDYEVAAIDEQSESAWRVFFQTPTERDRAAATLPGAFPDLALEPVDVPDEDWAARAQASLKAIRVGNIIVAPPWDVPDAGSLRPVAAGGRLRKPIVVVVQPSMGFGTGHHATTRLCLAALQQFEVTGGTVIDVGTGSGVLAIAARMLGAARVIAIDDDPDAVQSARDNAVLNGVTLDVRLVDFRTAVLSRFDLVLANLTGGLIMQSALRLQDLTARRGPIILSGFLAEEEPAVLASFPRMRVLDRNQEEEWVCVTLQHEAAFE